MATFSGSLNFAYFVDAPATPSANETGMQPALCSGIGYGGNPVRIAPRSHTLAIAPCWK